MWYLVPYISILIIYLVVIRGYDSERTTYVCVFFITDARKVWCELLGLSEP